MVVIQGRSAVTRMVPTTPRRAKKVPKSGMTKHFTRSAAKNSLASEGDENENENENDAENENENEDESGGSTRTGSKRPQRERTPAGVTRRVQSEGSVEGGIAPPVTDVTIATALQQLTAVVAGLQAQVTAERDEPHMPESSGHARQKPPSPRRIVRMTPLREPQSNEAEGPETSGTTMAASTPAMAAMATAVQQLATMVANMQPTTATGEEPSRSRDRPAPSRRSTRTPAAAEPSDDSPSDSDPESNGESSDPSDSSESGADEDEQNGGSSDEIARTTDRDGEERVETDMSDMNDVSDEYGGRA
ncbi:unnamed protein product [Phytophthora fragariaefolia]|uniref:Unnamed protein product n=1 Tax=Phytophthora fragariaefolia TaxID=1490495 RepID=A0A9W7CSX2_9STRA|nr:unnamed protein product [Phytophthora fragariaefolia]